MKLFAWSERGLVNAKDAQDSCQIMQGYGAAGNMDRLYEEEIDILKATDYDPDHAGACLLGKDVAMLANEETHKKLMAIIDSTSQMDRLAIHMAGPIHFDGTALTQARTLLELFKRGMKMRA